ncbi:MAG: hypothetical protein QM714_05045 [Nocardioides sp.]|uniref:antitoxin VbhA family protein n=1 Tax=Nocardioides sp. TaxID=35761 RepID=UPI0039E518EE
MTRPEEQSAPSDAGLAGTLASYRTGEDISEDEAITLAKAELAAARDKRARVVGEAIHSAEMEGLTVSEAAVSDSAAYVAGEIDSSDLIARARARYHLD